MNRLSIMIQPDASVIEMPAFTSKAIMIRNNNITEKAAPLFITSCTTVEDDDDVVFVVVVCVSWKFTETTSSASLTANSKR